MSEYLPLVGRVKAVPRTGETPGQRPVVCLEIEVEEWDLETTVLSTRVYRLACLRSWMWEEARELKEGSVVVAVGFRHEVAWRALDGGPSKPADVVCVVLEERDLEMEEELQILGLEQTSDPAQLDEILELLKPGVVL